MYTMRGRVASGTSTNILGRALSRALDFGEKGNRIVLDFRAKDLMVELISLNFSVLMVSMVDR